MNNDQLYLLDKVVCFAQWRDRNQATYTIIFSVQYYSWQTLQKCFFIYLKKNNNDIELNEIIFK